MTDITEPDSPLTLAEACEVANLADLDFYAVRDEGFRRQTVAEAKIARLQKQIAKAQAEMTEAALTACCTLRTHGLSWAGW